MNKIFSLVALAAMAAGPAFAASPDAEFMHKAAVGGMAEVSAGKLAMGHAMSSEVKTFADMMVKDHSKANTELMGLAKQEGVTLPTTLDAKHKAAADKLAKLEGAAFDKAYVAQMVKDHEETVMLFENEAQHGKDAKAKAWAAKTLPTLKMHLEHAKAMAAGKPMPHGHM